MFLLVFLRIDIHPKSLGFFDLPLVLIYDIPGVVSFGFILHV